MRVIRWLAVLGVVLATPDWSARPVDARPPELEWSLPQRISTSGGFAMYPFIVSDRQGRVHVFWSENVREPNNELSLDSIQYAVVDGGQVTEPIDVFVAPSGGQARLARVRIDDQDRLHMLVVSWPGIVYGVVDVANASDAKAWNMETIDEDAFTADFCFSSDGATNLVYVRSNEGVFFRRGRLGGGWGDPVSVWTTLGDDRSSGSVRLESHSSDSLHVAWGITAEENNWNPIGIAYARSIDQGQSWESTFELFEGDNQPALGFHGDSDVILFWNNPAGRKEGRGGSYSLDLGSTWASGSRVFPSYRGQTFPASMVQDGDGVLHLLFSANPPDDGFAHAFHATWDDGVGWSDPEEISGGYLGMEGLSATVALGNQLYVAWFTYEKTEYGIWLVSSTVNARSLEPSLVTTRRQPTLTGPIARETATRQDLSSPMTVAVATSEPLNMSLEPSASPWFPILLGVTAAGLIAIPLVWRNRGAR